MACVLVVDDEPDVRDLVARRLGSAGHDVLAADGPERALRLVADAGGHYLPKPFTGALLRGAVEAALWLPPAAPGARPTSR